MLYFLCLPMVLNQQEIFFFVLQSQTQGSQPFENQQVKQGLFSLSQVYFTQFFLSK